jgi:hypothetical protein
MNYALPSSYLFLSFTGEEELALSIQTTGPKLAMVIFALHWQSTMSWGVFLFSLLAGRISVFFVFVCFQCK